MWHDLLCKQAQRQFDLLIRQTSNSHIGEEVHHMLRLQVLERRHDVRWGANGAQGFLPTALRQFGVNAGVAG